jgi:hypothetical protein
MNNFWVSVLVFVCLSAAALGTMHLHSRLDDHLRSDETNTSSRGTFESIDSNMHAYATDIIIFDRTMRTYGPDADEVRVKLADYMKEAIANPAHADDPLTQKTDTAGARLDAVGHALAHLKPSNNAQQALLNELRQQYHSLIEQRWKIIEQSEGNIPSQIIAMLVAWLTLIFASYGYRAPKNRAVVTVFLTAALLLAISFYLVMDMDIPFSGPIQISNLPYQRALAYITH